MYHQNYFDNIDNNNQNYNNQNLVLHSSANNHYSSPNQNSRDNNFIHLNPGDYNFINQNAGYDNYLNRNAGFNNYIYHNPGSDNQSSVVNNSTRQNSHDTFENNYPGQISITDQNKFVGCNTVIPMGTSSNNGFIDQKNFIVPTGVIASDINTIGNSFSATSIINNNNNGFVDKYPTNTIGNACQNSFNPISIINYDIIGNQNLTNAMRINCMNTFFDNNNYYFNHRHQNSVANNFVDQHFNNMTRDEQLSYITFLLQNIKSK
ncbi:5542_t:CDS:1 [Entrophospora sp. SA101]|nr:8103_t:CDS:1 [Entrophospora sp. SA101]CAJ0888103.1 5542_t:CDS:1 [Entrophospora sp. SA101]